ncbi:MAG TPA: hypothetical protein VF767_03145 [Bryobacteraceae bacterium]
MDPSTRGPLNLDSEESAILSALLESEREKLLVEIRHTDHREFRDELRHKLECVERIAERLQPGSTSTPARTDTAGGG